MKYDTRKDIIIRDLPEILKSLNIFMIDERTNTSKIPTEEKEERVESNPNDVKSPVLAEIALTYRCQNRCDFCNISSSLRGKNLKEMTTHQVKMVIDKIHDDAKVNSISFTGGEPSMRRDLPEIIDYAVRKGMNTNLITNGIKCADEEFVKKLAASGLNSAQINLESHDEIIHNKITGNMESYKKTVSGIRNLKESRIETHTSTTICRGNRKHLIPLVKFVKEEFNFSNLSMNMMLSHGTANVNKNAEISYSSISGILEPVLSCSEETGIKMVWDSPTPYCMFNPVDHNLGTKSCTCVSGILSVNPAGEVISCSNFCRGLGNLLKDRFTDIWNSDEALYFREKRFIPPVCRKCSMKILCKGACPMYWENAGSFREIEKVNNRRPLIGNFFWSLENRLRLKTKDSDGAGLLR